MTAKQVRRRRWLAVLAITALAAGLLAWSLSRGPAPRPMATAASHALPVIRARQPTHKIARHAAAPVRAPSGPPAVGIRIVRFVDRSRVIRRAGGTVGPRTLLTIVRYPAVGPRGAVDLPGAPIAKTASGLPLVVFGHGFAVTPAPYSRLLLDWARAGYVVAAPVFPLENAGAPGGPHEADLVNQPRDMSFVISSLLSGAAPATRVFARAIDRHHIAVSGQSDGGDTALAAAFDPSVRDPRVTAAVILSGAEDPFRPAFRFASSGPALLATQGTADTVNPPSMTDAFFRAAHRPKYLLELLGASHQPPYTEPGSELSTVERVTVAFLDTYLRLDASARRRLLSSRIAGRDAVLRASP